MNEREMMETTLRCIARSRSASKETTTQCIARSRSASKALFLHWLHAFLLIFWLGASLPKAFATDLAEAKRFQEILPQILPNSPKLTHTQSVLTPTQKLLAAALKDMDPTIFIRKIVEREAESRLFSDPRFTPNDFVAIATTKSMNPKARFWALYILGINGSDLYDSIPKLTRSKILTTTLAKNLLGADEPWGMLWRYDYPGELGQMIVSIGKDAIPDLKRLLKKRNWHNNPPKSEDALYIHASHYRLKDYAAFYIAKIHHYNLPAHNRLKDRDKAIEAMRLQLAL